MPESHPPPPSITRNPQKMKSTSFVLWRRKRAAAERHRAEARRLEHVVRVLKCSDRGNSNVVERAKYARAKQTIESHLCKRYKSQVFVESPQSKLPTLFHGCPELDHVADAILHTLGNRHRAMLELTSKCSCLAVARHIELKPQSE